MCFRTNLIMEKQTEASKYQETDDQSDMENKVPAEHTDQPSISGNKYYILMSGKTLECHEVIIKRFQGIPGLEEVKSVDECDVIVVLCTIVSRRGTNIEVALDKLNNLSECKPAVLMVLHHTFDPEKTVPDSSRCVNRTNTFTLDFLFHEDVGLLKCMKNDEALDRIQQWLQPQTQLGSWTSLMWPFNWCQTFKGIDQDEIPIVGKQKTKSKEIDETLKDKDVCVASELVIVLLGMSGSGKTAAKNMIFEREETSQAGDSTATQEITAKRGSVDMDQVCVIDTPDYWFSSGFSMEQMKEKIQLISMCCGGPHAFLLVIPEKNEFTKEEREMVKNMEKMFEEICCEKVMILFTINDEAENLNIQKHQDLLKKCGERFHFFSLSQKGRDQVTQLLEKIQKMVKGNKESSDKIGIDIAHQTPNLERERNYMKVQYYMRTFWITKSENSEASDNFGFELVDID